MSSPGLPRPSVLDTLRCPQGALPQGEEPSVLPDKPLDSWLKQGRGRGSRSPTCQAPCSVPLLEVRTRTKHALPAFLLPCPLVQQKDKRSVSFIQMCTSLPGDFILLSEKLCLSRRQTSWLHVIPL